MRIGVFTYDFFPWEGGVGRHVFEIQEQLKQFKDIDVIIFSPCKNDLPNHKMVCAFSKIFGKNILFSLYVNIFIYRLIRKYKLDLLHFHAGSGGVFLIKKLKQKTIVTMHTNNYLFQYRRFGVFSKFLLSPLEKLTYETADQILPVSSYVKKNLINDYRIPKFKISVIPNGVNTDIFFPTPYRSNSDINILYVGRLYKGKGIEFLIDAVERLIADHPSLRLIVAGEGKYIKSLKTYIQAKTVCDHIIFLGWKDSWALNKLYNKATVYVMPSIVEGFGLSLLEAMACKCPVIATDSGGSIDIIHHDYNGLLVSYGDTTQLTTAINSLLKNEIKKNKFAHNGFETARTFSWETIAKKLYIVYKQSDSIQNRYPP